MGLTTKKEIIIPAGAVYDCDQCSKSVPAKSAANADRPTGYYFHVRRVTELFKHHMTDGELFFCSKPCAEQYVQYGMSRSYEPVMPDDPPKVSRD